LSRGLVSDTKSAPRLRAAERADVA